MRFRTPTQTKNGSKLGLAGTRKQLSIEMGEHVQRLVSCVLNICMCIALRIYKIT